MKSIICIIEPNPALRYILKTVIGYKFTTRDFDSHLPAMVDPSFYNASAYVVNLKDENDKNFDFLLHIKSSAGTAGKVVMVITESENAALADRCYNIGVDKVYIKPFDPLLLLNDCDQLLNDETGGSYKAKYA